MTSLYYKDEYVYTFKYSLYTTSFNLKFQNKKYYKEIFSY